MTNQFVPEKEQLHILLKKAITTGFFGGIFGSILWLMLYGLNMVKINPISFWDHFFWGNFSFNKWYMYLVAIVLYSLLSILFALIYYVLFKRLGHWMMGFIYGIFIWAFFLFVIPFLFYNRFFISDYTNETLIGLCCVGVLYGLFIGYSISFDYRMIRNKSKKEQ